MLQLQNQSNLFDAGREGISGAAPSLAAPTNPDISDASSAVNRVFTWTNNAVGATGNEVWRALDGGAYSLLATVAAGATSYADGEVISATYAEYKVRAVNASVQSSFSAPRGVSYTLGDITLTDYNYPYLVINFGVLNISDNSSQTVNFPLLRHVYGGGISFNAPLNSLNLNSLVDTDVGIVIQGSALTTISLPSFTGPIVGDSQFDVNPALINLLLPAMTSAPGQLTCLNCASIQVVSAPLLQTVSGNLDFGDNTTLNQVNLSSLVTAGGTIFLPNLSSLTNLQLGALQTVAQDLNCPNLFNLGDLTLPSLQTVGGLINFDQCAALTADFSSLVSVGQSISLAQLSGLTSLSMPALTTVTSDFVFNGTALTSVNFPNWVITDGATVDGSSGALDVTSANHIMARAVASGVTTCTITIIGGTNAVPTGAGLTNCDTLVANGNVVYTNEGITLSASGSALSWTIHRTPPTQVQIEKSDIGAGSWSVLATVAWGAAPYTVPSDFDYQALGLAVDTLNESNTVTINAHTTASGWSTRVVNNGGAAPSTATVRAFSDFCYRLDAKGLTSLIMTLNLFAPDSLTACLVPLIRGAAFGGFDMWANVSNNFVSGDLNVNGLLGNGSSKWLGTNIVPSAAFSGNNSATLFCYESTTTVGNVVAIGASASLSTRGLELFTNSFSVGAYLWDCWDNDSAHGRTDSGPTAFTNAGFTLATRTGANAAAIYFANSGTAWTTIKTSANASTGVHGDVTKDVGVFVQNTTTGQFFFSNRRMSCAGIAAGMTSQQGQDLYDAVQACRVTLGGGYV